MQEQQQEHQRNWAKLLQGTLDLNENELRLALKAAAPEQRFAAALVIGEKRLPWTSELTEAITDRHPAVVQAARRSLVILSFLALNPAEAALIASPNPSRLPTPLAQLKRPVDFGPAPAAGAPARALAARKWTEWWDQQNSSQTQLVVSAGLKESPLPDTPPGRLAATLLNADPQRQRDLVQEYRDAKGVQFTDAMALAASRMSGDSRRELREALAERMTRMTEATLGRYLEDECAEVRRAAVLGLAMRESKVHAARMIEMLQDPEPAVGRAAYAALCRLSGKDFGPRLGATQEECAEAMIRWKAWAKSQR